MSGSHPSQPDGSQFKAFYYKILGSRSTLLQDQLRRVSLAFLALAEAPTSERLCSLQDDLWHLETMLDRYSRLKEAYPPAFTVFNRGLVLNRAVEAARRLQGAIKEHYVPNPGRSVDDVVSVQ